MYYIKGLKHVGRIRLYIMLKSENNLLEQVYHICIFMGLRIIELCTPFKHHKGILYGNTDGTLFIRLFLIAC